MIPLLHRHSPLRLQSGDTSPWALPALVAGLLGAPWLLQALGWPEAVPPFARAMALAIAAGGLCLVSGPAGRPHLAQASLVALGPLVLDVTRSLALPTGAQLALALVLALPLGALLSMLLEALLRRLDARWALPLSLLPGLALALVTHALAQHRAQTVASAWPAASSLLLAPLMLSLNLLLLDRLLSSPWGLLLQGARDNGARLQALGQSVDALRRAAFGLSGAMAAGAGVVLGTLGDPVAPPLALAMQSIDLLALVLIGGLGSIWAGVAGAAVMLALTAVFSFWAAHAALWLAALALMSVGGLAGLPQRLTRRATRNAAWGQRHG